MFKGEPPKATEIATLPYIDAPRAMEDFIEDIVDIIIAKMRGGILWR